MTNKALKRRLVAVIAAVVIVLIASLVEYFYRPPNSQNTFIGGNSTLIALLAAAYLAFVFQQRGKFIDELRKWWNDIVEAKSDFFIYCDKSNPTEDDFFRSYYKLSTSMDTLRLIFCNVGRSKQNPKGLYPFDQVRDIIEVAKSLCPEQKPTRQSRKRAKQAIDLIFQSLRHAIQAEANASPPDDPTLYESEYRLKYLKEIRENLNLDLERVRQKNRQLDYVSSREKEYKTSGNLSRPPRKP